MNKTSLTIKYLFILLLFFSYNILSSDEIDGSHTTLSEQAVTLSLNPLPENRLYLVHAGCIPSDGILRASFGKGKLEFCGPGIHQIAPERLLPTTHWTLNHVIDVVSFSHSWLDADVIIVPYESVSKYVISLSAHEVMLVGDITLPPRTIICARPSSQVPEYYQTGGFKIERLPNTDKPEEQRLLRKQHIYNLIQEIEGLIIVPTYDSKLKIWHPLTPVSLDGKNVNTPLFFDHLLRAGTLAFGHDSESLMGKAYVPTICNNLMLQYIMFRDPIRSEEAMALIRYTIDSLYREYFDWVDPIPLPDDAKRTLASYKAKIAALHFVNDSLRELYSTETLCTIQRCILADYKGHDPLKEKLATYVEGLIATERTNWSQSDVKNIYETYFQNKITFLPSSPATKTHDENLRQTYDEGQVTEIACVCSWATLNMSILEAKNFFGRYMSLRGNLSNPLLIHILEASYAYEQMNRDQTTHCYFQQLSPGWKDQIETMLQSACHAYEHESRELNTFPLLQAIKMEPRDVLRKHLQQQP